MLNRCIFQLKVSIVKYGKPNFLGLYEELATTTTASSQWFRHCSTSHDENETKRKLKGEIGDVYRKRGLEETKLRLLNDFRQAKEQIKGQVDKLTMSENVYTIPNFLCVCRIGMAPVLGYMVLHQQYAPAICVLFIAGLTDLADGWVARMVPGQSSVIGSFLDPMADKILVGTMFLSLTYINLIPVPLTALIIGRDVLLIAAGFVIRYKSLQPPRTISRYFDVTHATAQLSPTLISKANTFIQMILIGATMIHTVLPYDHTYLVALWYCTGASTILSALSYIFAKNTYKILRQTEETQVPSKKPPH